MTGVVFIRALKVMRSSLQDAVERGRVDADGKPGAIVRYLNTLHLGQMRNKEWHVDRAVPRFAGSRLATVYLSAGLLPTTTTADVVVSSRCWRCRCPVATSTSAVTAVVVCRAACHFECDERNCRLAEAQRDVDRLVQPVCGDACASSCKGPA
jgi:hypothetical protein